VPVDVKYFGLLVEDGMEIHQVLPDQHFFAKAVLCPHVFCAWIYPQVPEIFR